MGKGRAALAASGLTMCGIAGLIFDQALDETSITARVRAMCDAQQARGPDGTSTWTDGRVGLGSVRLAIVGSPGRARQPIMGPSGARMVFNGELYAPADVMAGLGGTFGPDDCDGQALLRLLEARGVNGLRGVEAMFALAMHSPDGSVLLARDAWGQKPLLVSRGPGYWAFASTVAAMHAGTGALRIREAAVHECLIYKSVGGLGSAFEGLRQVAPGSWMRIDPDGACEEGRWFDLPAIDDTDADEATVRERLDVAIRQRCPTDRRAALFLSGGLDSSVVSAVAADEARSSGTPLPHVFSVGYEAGGWRDEHGQAEELADELGLDHQALVLRATDVPDLMRDAAVALEDPIHDPVTVPTLALTRAAATETRVVLTGDGADEFWGGYSRFDDAPDDLNEYLRRTTVFEPVELGLVAPPASYLDGVELAPSSLPPLDRIMRLEASNRLRNYHLSRVDKLSMAAGLEARSPFVDLAVTSLAAGLSAGVKRPGGRPKGLLAESVRPLLPSWVIERPKQPFTVPIQSWLDGALRDFAHDTLRGDTFVSRYTDPTPYVDGTARGLDGAQLAMRIWSLLHLEIWYGSFARAMQAAPRP